MLYGLPSKILSKYPLPTKNGYWCWQSAFIDAIDKSNMLPGYIYENLPWYLTIPYEVEDKALHKYYPTKWIAELAYKIAIKKHIKNELKQRD